MAPVQNKFIIVPNAPPSAINGNGGNLDSDSLPILRPMTTKQAKKAYQQKNKGARLSKAEQRKQDLFEQDRIRREFEKEKNQARARAARDRKKEKEDKERADKKKKGLPLIEVHPSQDTISRFVFSKPRKQSNSTPEPPQDVVQDARCDDGDSDSKTLSDGDDDGGEDEDEDQEPPPKKQRMETSPPCDPESVKCSPEVVTEPVHVAQDVDEDPIVAIDDAIKSPKQPPRSFDDILEDELVCQQLLSESLGAPSSPTRGEKIEEVEELQDHESFERVHIDDEWPPSKWPGTPRSQGLNDASEQHAVMTDPSRIVEKQHSQPIIFSPVLATGPTEVHTAKPQKDIAPPVARRALQDLPAKEVNVRNHLPPLQPRTSSAKQTTTPRQSHVNSPKHMFRKPSAPVSSSHLSSRPQSVTPMGPPPRPPKFRSPTYTTSTTSNRPRFINKNPQSKHRSSLGTAQLGQDPSIPPSSTQQFMMSHLDDFFPSPSQEVRELYEEPASPLGTKPSQAISTSQDSIAMSSPSIRQMQPARKQVATDAPARAYQIGDNEPIAKSPEQNAEFGSQASTLATQPPCKSEVGKSSIVDIPFFSSKDFLLSQDWMDQKDDTHLPPETQSCNGGALAKPVLVQAEPDSNYEIPNDLKTSSLSREKTSIKTHNQSQRRQPGPSSQTNRNGRGITKTGHSPKNTPIPANASQPTSRLQNKLGPRRLTSEEQLNTTPNNARRSSGRIPQFNEKTMQNASQSTNTSTSQEKRISQPATTRASEPSAAHATKTQKPPPAQPRPSPKPLFASTNRDFRSKYLIERNKTAIWEGSSARRKVQADMDQFNQEEEAAERLLIEYMCKHQEEASAVASTAPTMSNEAAATTTTTTTTGQRSCDEPPPPPPPSIGRPKKQTVNQLSSCPPPTNSTAAAAAAKRDAPTQRAIIRPGSGQQQQRRPNSRPGGSYEEMLALLEQQQIKKTTQQPKEEMHGGAAVVSPPAPPAPLPAASQETDYGDVELDDEFYEFF